MQLDAAFKPTNGSWQRCPNAGHGHAFQTNLLAKRNHEQATESMCRDRADRSGGARARVTGDCLIAECWIKSGKELLRIVKRISSRPADCNYYLNKQRASFTRHLPTGRSTCKQNKTSESALAPSHAPHLAAR